jgi:hypothetical protein
MTEKTVTKKWTDANITALLAAVGNSSPVTADLVEAAAEKLGFTTRSIASKLRQLDFEVDSMAKAKVSAFTVDQGEALIAFVSANPGQFTYKDIAEQFADGAFSAKQIQGKLLALELTGSVKPAEKVEAARTYTEAEEAKFITLVNAGTFIEDIATALDKSIASVRGKALSLTRSGAIPAIPKQRESHATKVVDPVADLGDNIAAMTVAEIATASDKTERGIKTLLTRRGIKVADYDGQAKRAKAEAKAVAA